MLRRLLNLLTALSLLLGVAVAVLWTFGSPGGYVGEFGLAGARWRLTAEGDRLTLNDLPRALAEWKESGRLLSQWSEQNRQRLEAHEAELEFARLLAMSDPVRSASEFARVTRRVEGLPPPPTLKTPRPLSEYAVSYGTLLVAASALPAARLAWMGLGWRRRKRAARIAAGLCPHCGYDLRATPGRCPECGRAASVSPGG